MSEKIREATPPASSETSQPSDITPELTVASTALSRAIERQDDREIAHDETPEVGPGKIVQLRYPNGETEDMLVTADELSIPEALKDAVDEDILILRLSTSLGEAMTGKSVGDEVAVKIARRMQTVVIVGIKDPLDRSE